MKFKVSTKPAAGAQAKETILTIDWTGITEDQLKQGFAAYATVKIQGRWRKNGIPAEETVRAVDLAPGTRTVATAPLTKESIAAKAATDATFRAEMLALLQGMK